MKTIKTIGKFILAFIMTVIIATVLSYLTSQFEFWSQITEHTQSYINLLFALVGGIISFEIVKP